MCKHFLKDNDAYPCCTCSGEKIECCGILYAIYLFKKYIERRIKRIKMFFINLKLNLKLNLKKNNFKDDIPF